MKKTQILAIAALAAAATFQTEAKAEDPVSPVPGAVCNLYWVDIPTDGDPKAFRELATSLPQMPAAATFVDVAGDFKDSQKLSGVHASAGMWTGWLKTERAGTYTFLCKRFQQYCYYRYSIWVNGQKCIDAELGQSSFNADLQAGFNFVKIITGNHEERAFPLSITYKKAGDLKEPMTLGPADMFHDEEED